MDDATTASAAASQVQDLVLVPQSLHTPPEMTYAFSIAWAS